MVVLWFEILGAAWLMNFCGFFDIMYAHRKLQLEKGCVHTENKRRNMSEENANVGENTESIESNDTSKKVTEKISEYSGKVDSLVEGALGIIGNRPWDSWLDTANKYISMFLPAVIALAGVLACLTGLITMIKNDAPFSMVVKQLFVLVPALFAMHLAPKALALTRSFIEKGEPVVIRPELMYIMKVICGVGGVLLGAYLLLGFGKDLLSLAIVAIIFAVLMIICLERPGIVGVKAGYPVNCVEEVIALVLFPVRVLIALLTLLVGMAAAGGLVYGIVQWFDDGLSAALVFCTTALVPFVVPLIVYFIYLVVVFTLDFYRAIVSIPRKLDEMKK